MISIIVYGDPKPQVRHRHVKRGNFVTTYDPSAKDKEEFLKNAMDGCPSEKPLEGALHVHCTFVFSRPKSHYGTGRNSDVLKENAPEHHITRKDIDNLQKFVFDALNGHYYVDDSQIVSVIAHKRYVDIDDESGTYIIIQKV